MKNRNELLKMFWDAVFKEMGWAIKLAIIFVILSAIVVVVFLFVLPSPKLISIDTFEQKCKEYGMETEDISLDYADYRYVNKVIYAKDKDNSEYVFFEMKTKDKVDEAYDGIRNNFLLISPYDHKRVENGDLISDKYESDGTYYYIDRIENTILVYVGYLSNKEDVEDFIDSIRYK